MVSPRHPRSRWVTAAAAAALLVASACAAKQELVKVEFLADTRSVAPGQSFAVGALFHIQDGWHIYWRNPGDAGLATALDLDLPAGFEAGPIQWPLPETFHQGGGILGYGYQHTVLLWRMVRAPKALREGTAATISLEASWLACKSTCIPGEVTGKLTLPLGNGAAPANRELFASWRRRLPATGPAPFHQHVHGGIPKGGTSGQFRIHLHWDKAPTGVEWLPAPDEGLLLEDVAVRTTDKETAIAFTASLIDNAKVETLQSLMVYTSKEGRRTGVSVSVRLRAVAEEHHHAH